jgi:4-oxalocrotonate tautomerase
MPYIHILLGGAAPDQAQCRTLIDRTTRLMVEVMGKRAEVTSVALSPLPADHWGIGGAPVTAQGPRPAHVDVKITTGTNTPAEKARLVAELRRMLEDVAGPIAEASYVVIHELAADAWGYGGLTQAARREAAAANTEGRRKQA